MLEECVLSAQCLEGGRGTDLALDEPAQPQAHELGAYTHRGPAPLRWIPAKKLTATIVSHAFESRLDAARPSRAIERHGGCGHLEADRHPGRERDHIVAT